MQSYLKKNEKRQRDSLLNVTHSKIDIEKRTVELSFSSNEPYARWGDVSEVLDHNSQAIDLSRLNNKGALLANHDWNKQIGVIEEAYIDGDKARAVVKFSQRQEAQDYFQDVQDGIIANVSVGYSVDDVEYNEKNSTATVTRWQPFEISLVSVPADPTVGVGRSLEQSNTNQKNNALTQLEKNTTNQNQQEKHMSTEAKLNDQTKSYDEGAKAEAVRRDAIESLAQEFNQAEYARNYIKSGATFADFQKDLMLHVQSDNKKKLADMEKSNPTVDAVKSNASNIGLSEKEVKSFHLSKAIYALSNPVDLKAREAAAFEFEASEAAKRNLRIYDNSFMIPNDVLQRGFTVAGGGNALVGTELKSSAFVDILRNKSIMMNLSNRLSGLVGNIAIPRQIQGSDIYWVGEDEDVGDGNIVTDQIMLSPKTLGSCLKISQALLINSSLDAENMVRNDLLAAIALGIDTAALYGTGTANQPLGLTSTTGIATHDYADWAPMMADYIELETRIATQNADTNSMRYLLNPTIRGTAKYIPRMSGSDQPIWEPGNTINGYGTEVTNQINHDQVIFGDFSQMIIGLWDGLRLTVDPYTGAKSGSVRVVAMQNMDIAVRRPESFCIANKAA